MKYFTFTDETFWLFLWLCPLPPPPPPPPPLKVTPPSPLKSRPRPNWRKSVSSRKLLLQLNRLTLLPLQWYFTLCTVQTRGELGTWISWWAPSEINTVKPSIKDTPKEDKPPNKGQAFRNIHKSPLKEDSLSTKDKTVGPEGVLIKRFHCMACLNLIQSGTFRTWDTFSRFLYV